MTDTTSERPEPRSPLDRGVQGVIGRPVDRVDGPAKVTGAARYAHETDPDGTLHGHVVGATIGCGRIVAVHADAARAAAGVVAVIVDDPRIPSDSAGGAEKGLPGFTRDIGYFGQPVGIVVAESLEQARAAARLVRVDYEVGEGRFDPAAVEEIDPEPASAFVRNVDIGDLDTALAASAVRYDATFTTPHHLPAAMEPHATTAWWEGDRLTLRSSLQGLSGPKRKVAGTLGIEPEQVRILAPFVGGGFGGKTGTGTETVMAAVAAREVGRPVKVALSRRQTAQLVHRRSETEQRIRIGCDAQGHILAIAQESVVSQKDGRGFVEPVPFGSLPLYAGKARRFTTALRRVDLPTAGAVRAPGEAIGTLSLETAIDEMAEMLGIDPVAFRQINEPASDPGTGKPFSTRRLIACYDEGARRFGWERRAAKPAQRRDGAWWIGMGMATAFRGNFTVESKARVRIDGSGRATIETDMTDIGTGTYTIAAQVAGEMLGLDVDRVAVTLGDSELPVSAGSGGSFGAGSTGSAIALACETIVAELARRMETTPEEMTLKDGHAIAGNRRVPIGELVGAEAIEAIGHAKPGEHTSRTSQASHGAHFAEVAVHAVTGEVRVRRFLGVFDVGRVLNEKTARSQIVGGIIWGIGYALVEEGVVDRRSGQFVNPDFGEYHIPVHADVPHIDVHFVEEHDRFANEVGAKAVGELGISGAGAAVTNAIYHACGVRVRDFPMTLDKILAGLPDV